MHQVKISVIVPTYNRAEQLRMCLEALFHQTQPSSDYEIIVVIDGSTDDTVDMLASLKAPCLLHIIYQSNRGQSAALNRGVAVARGRTLIFIDDDLIAAPTLVAEHFRLHLERKGVVGIGQMTLSVPQDADWFAQELARDWKEHYEHLNQGSRKPAWDDCYGGNMSIAKATYQDIGGNDESLWRSKDMDLACRLERHGCEFVYLPEALGHLDERKDFRELTTDAERTGAGCVQINERYPFTLFALLGPFSDASPPERLLRRVLLALGVPPLILGPIGQIVRFPTFGQKWFRFLRTYCYWRGVKRAIPDRDTWRRLTYGTPILMYHAFGAPGEEPSRYVVPARGFRRQMALLKWLGYHVISLEEYVRLRRNHRLAPHRSVILTIDDGYADNRTIAYPILRRYGFPATIFLVTGRIGSTCLWARSRQLQGRPMLSWLHAEEMLKGRIQFGSHTRTHPVLTGVLPDQLQQELNGSRTDFEYQLGARLDVLAYPYGEYDSRLQAQAEAAGFIASCTIESGLNTPRTPLHALRRIEMYGTDTLLHFVLALWLGRVPSILRRQIRAISLLRGMVRQFQCKILWYLGRSWIRGNR
jgi:peptidoglycan/xylan/chitin deacetylase (PgdA/CDA1 family)/GT2 family glycosyltransferase